MKSVKDVNIDWSFLESRIRIEQANLERAKVMSDSRNKLAAEYQAVEELTLDLDSYRRNLKLLLVRVTKENDDFRSSRLKYLGDTITDAISTVFPAKNLKAHVNCDFKRKDSVDLRLTDDEGHVFKPTISNGKLMQYLISFSAVSRIAEALGSHNLYVDEAFGVSSENNLPVVGEIINEKIRSGMQVILVSQNAALYTDVPRREIRMHYDFANKKAVLDEIVDIG